MPEAQTTQWATREFGNVTARRDRDDAEMWAGLGEDRGREAVVVLSAEVYDALVAGQRSIGENSADAVAKAAHYFRDMSRDTMTRREVIETLDYLASEHRAVASIGTSTSTGAPR